MIKLPAFNLRVKLALVAVLLLALPWAGYNYVREMERFLLEGEEQALLATARGVATALHDRPGLLRAPPSRDDELRREAEEELRRLAAERGEIAPGQEGAEAGASTTNAASIIDREDAVAARREIEEIPEAARRLLSGSAYKVGHGYILGLPVAAYLTWQGRMLENNGIAPKFSIELSREALKQGRDTQLETAVEVAKAL